MLDYSSHPRMLPAVQLRLLPLFLLLLLAIAFSGLGVWQLQRAGEKQSLMQRLQNLETISPQSLAAFSESVDYRFTLLELDGHWAETTPIQVESGQSGSTALRVILPFVLESSGQHVLVELGRSRKPARRLSPAELPSAPLIALAITPPQPALQLDYTVSPGTPLPYLSVAHLSEQLGYSLQPYLLLQYGKNPAGLTTQLPQPVIGESMHLGYALQWFAFALLALGFGIWLGLFRGKEENP